MQGASSSGGGGAAEPDAPEIARLLARFACNSHTICDNELRPVGAPHVEGVQCWQCTVLSYATNFVRAKPCFCARPTRLACCMDFRL